jgi:UDP-N-acetylmuramoyl-tripeptide--D-alanyl-D-alanine ligase
MFTLNDIIQGNTDRVRLLSSQSLSLDMVFRSAHHDSRQIGPGDLFIAIKGARVDGHQFIPAVARAGALGALCNEPSTDVPPAFLQIVVPDVVEALQATARVRTQRQEHTTLIGITGSNGKTSTKEAIAEVLGHKAPTLKTQASYNNEIGYPLTLLRLEPEHRYAVLEMGAQWVGELAWLCRTIARPDWSLITNVGTAHLEFFKSQERITIAKSELVQALTDDGIAILNYDDLNVRSMSTKTQGRILYYGFENGAHVRASSIGGDTLFGRSFTLNYQQQQCHVQLHLPGEHGVLIALAAAAVGCAAEMSLDEIALALETLAPAKGRGEIKPGPHGSTIIDDTYNANRQSIAAITSAMHAATLPSASKRWAVVGDIFELGPFAHEEHQMSGEIMARNVDYLIALGDEARFYAEGALKAGMPDENVYYFQADVENSSELEASKQAIAELLKKELKNGDLVLIKGSRGMRMETLLEML